MNIDWDLDVQDFPVELKLLLELIDVETDTEAQAMIDSSGRQINWQSFYSLTRHHRVYPTIHERLSHHPLSGLPEGMVQQLSVDYSRNALMMLQLSGKMKQVSEALDNKGIYALQLKGPALAEALYGSLSRRTSKDLDILVHPDHIEQAEEVLEQLGYIKTQEVSRIVSDWKWRQNHESFTHEDTGTEVELHWRLNGDAGAEPSFYELWNRRQTLAFAGTDVHMLSNEDLMFYLTAHGARHAWFRLRWLADIDRLARMELDWDKLTALLRRYKCTHLVGQALILSAAMFNTPISREMALLMSTDRPQDLARRVLIFIREKVSLCPEPESEILAQIYRNYLFSLRTPGQKAIFLARKMVPDTWDTQTLPLPKSLRFLYYPLHPFLLLHRRIQRRSALEREVGQ